VKRRSDRRASFAAGFASFSAFPALKWEAFTRSLRPLPPGKQLRSALNFVSLNAMQRNANLRYDAAAIRDALTPADVMRRHGLDAPRRGPCPLCGTSDRSQAFAVYPDGFKCFACGEHGDSIDLEAKLSRVSPGEAMRTLAGVLGLSPGKPPSDAAKIMRQLRRDQRATAKRAVSGYLNALADSCGAAERCAENWQRAALEAGTEADVRACNARAAFWRAEAARAEEAGWRVSPVAPAPLPEWLEARPSWIPAGARRG